MILLFSPVVLWYAAPTVAAGMGATPLFISFPHTETMVGACASSAAAAVANSAPNTDAAARSTSGIFVCYVSS